MNSLQEQLERALAGRYRLERELGQGGMAVVFLAQDLRHDRKVALKVLRPDLSAAIGAERFLREIKLAAGLTHPHILPVYDSGQAGELLFYVMPNMAGRSLRERLQRERQLPLADALAITREVASALGKRRAILPMPIPLIRLVAGTAERVRIPFPVATDQLRQLKLDNIGPLDVIPSRFGFQPLPMEGALGYLRERQRDQVVKPGRPVDAEPPA